MITFSCVVLIMAYWLSWLERRPVTAEVEGSSPFWVVCFNNNMSDITSKVETLYIYSMGS